MLITPPRTIGIIGGGQLGRMMCLSAKAMGYTVAVLEPVPNCPTGQVADIEITAAYNDMDAIKKLTEISDVITYEFENIDYDALAYLEKNAYLPQRSDVLKTTQHRFREKEAIAAMGISVPDFQLISGADELRERVYYPSVLKTTMGGYDGKGQAMLRSEADLPKGLEIAEKAECILEKFMPFIMEVSVMVVRSTTGETAVYPVSENVHVNSIIHLSIVPARISAEVAKKAQDCAVKIAEGLNVIGALGVEMYVMPGANGSEEEIFVNEVAPRPHNSGHYTIDACLTSQFEQHVRAVCGLPLGPTDLHTDVVMVNILGQHLNASQMHELDAYMPLLKLGGKLHLYGKADALNGRKMGHVNILSKKGHINMLGSIEESLKAIESTRIWG